MKSKIHTFKKCCEVLCFALLGGGVVMLFGLPEYIAWLPEGLAQVAQRAGITSDQVLFVVISGIGFGSFAFGCDVLTCATQARKEVEDGKTI